MKKELTKECVESLLENVDGQIRNAEKQKLTFPNYEERKIN